MQTYNWAVRKEIQRSDIQAIKAGKPTQRKLNSVAYVNIHPPSRTATFPQRIWSTHILQPARTPTSLHVSKVFPTSLSSPPLNLFRRIYPKLEMLKLRIMTRGNCAAAGSFEEKSEREVAVTSGTTPTAATEPRRSVSRISRFVATGSNARVESSTLRASEGWSSEAPSTAGSFFADRRTGGIAVRSRKFDTGSLVHLTGVLAAKEKKKESKRRKELKEYARVEVKSAVKPKESNKRDPKGR